MVQKKLLQLVKILLSWYNIKAIAELKNSQIETSRNGYGTELDEVLETIENQLVYDVNELKEFFWHMLIVDSLVGNFDRHNGNDKDDKNYEIGNICVRPKYQNRGISYRYIRRNLY